MRNAFLVLLSMFMIQNLSAAEVIYPRTPAPSPDGSQIAFSYQGDIWTMPAGGGEARRLTAHPAYDYLPEWSPDGSAIAFSSERYGNFDVYLMDFDSSKVRQLTYFTSHDRVSGWSPDGNQVLFYSFRNFYYHRLPLTYQVSINGSTPEPVVPEYAYTGKLSPDGKYFVFVKGRFDWSRKNYRGSSNTNIYLYNFETEKYSQLTDFDGMDAFPLWSTDSQTIYFLSDRDGTKNLWKTDIHGRNKEKLTNFSDADVLFPNISANGNIIAFEHDFQLWTYNLQSGEAKQLEISLPIDFVSNPVEYQTYTSDVSDFQLNEPGALMTFSVRGEVFAMQEDGDFLTSVYQSPWRDHDVTWIPGKDSLLFVSDKNGQNDIFLAFSDDQFTEEFEKSTQFRVEPWIATDAEESSPVFSPDGKYLTYIRGKGDIILRDMETDREKTLLEGWSTPTIRWSPDSRWIAFSIADAEFNNDVHIMDVSSGSMFNITQHPDYDYMPRWSPDGRRLAFISQRTIHNNPNVYFIYLNDSDEALTDVQWDELYENSSEDSTQVQITVDVAEIHERIHRVTSLPGSESHIAWSPGGEYLVFTSDTDGKRDLWKVKWDGSDPEQLTSGGEDPHDVFWHAENDRIYYLDNNGRIVSLNDSGNDKQVKSFRAQVKIDHPKEQRQKFNEAWRTLHERFYDPEFHGTDWQKIKTRYEKIIPHVYTTRDFNDVVELMIGELNASHSGISGPSSSSDVQSGMLGLRFDHSYEGPGLKIREVIPDGPCDQADSQVEADEILIAVDGNPLRESVNLQSLLWNTQAEQVRLTLRNPDKRRDNERVVIVRPVSHGQLMNLEYDRWVKEKRDKVHEWSNGKLGYIHIRSMGGGPLEKFEMLLYAEAHDKDGLVIDVRNNGGGWTTDYLLAMLTVENHAVTIPRDGGIGYPQGRRPLYAWTKPIIVLTNEYSYSNAEIFAHAVQTLDRGKVVGLPTGGLVISTGGIQLIDGSTFRVPFRGWYVKDKMLNMENNGAVPDIIVHDQPGDTNEKRDRQLERAVEELQKEL